MEGEFQPGRKNRVAGLPPPRGAVTLDKDVIKMQINMTKGYNRGRMIGRGRIAAPIFLHIERSHTGVIGRDRER